jgi:membrane-bound lytic murein transglycosylase A
MFATGLDAMRAAALIMTTIVSTTSAVAEARASSDRSPELLPVSFRDLPGWAGDDHGAAFAAFQRSCPPVVASDRDKRSALAAVCRQALARAGRRISNAEARGFFEHFFAPHTVSHAAPGGLLTGYYEPHVRGSRTPTARFRVPIYKRPPDLENVVSESRRGATGAALTHMRRTASGLEPYPTRAEIEAGALAGKGLELVWLPDPVDAFFTQVQGSARILLPDGNRIAISYDGKNGHPYTSIGRVLIDRGAISAEAMSMQTLGAWLRADEARGKEVMHHNASFAFFRELTADEGGAQGAIGVPLTPGRSLAVDTSVHALGTPVYVDAPRLRHWGARKPFRRLMIAQDVGSAIRGPERGDIYFGSGELAGARAGITKHPGRFFVLLPRTGAKAP